MYASLLVNEFVGIISLRLDGLTQMIRTTMFASYASLIPLHGVAIATTLVVFKGIGKRGSIATEGEIIAGVWGQNHRTAHAETVKVAL